MNVLVLDDRGSSSFYLIEWLNTNSHKVFEAFNLNDAQSFWNDREMNPIHCIILDLNVPSDGLTDVQKERSIGGLISGWIWFFDNVLITDPSMKVKTIIYSDYIHYLIENKDIKKEDYERIPLIPKRQRYSSAEDVVARIKAISNVLTHK